MYQNLNIFNFILQRRVSSYGYPKEKGQTQ